MSIYRILKYLYPEITLNDIELIDHLDKKGVQIKYWNTNKLGNKLTIEQIKSKEKDAITYWNNITQTEQAYKSSLINKLKILGLTDNEIKYLSIKDITI